MPELPEVEITRRGILSHLEGQSIHHLIVRDYRLRWPIPKNLAATVKGQLISSVNRRAKYLLIQCETGAMILHLGMSGSLRILDEKEPAEKHDHFDIVLSSGKCLRYRDPRRFGALLWTNQDPLQHARLINLGVEPLLNTFDGQYLWQRARARKLAVKNFIMDGNIVVGVGNIYASEALFQSGIRPQTQTSKVSAARFDVLAATIKTVLADAIKSGGTTLRDFTQSDGNPGYFKQQLAVYGRANMPCTKCDAPIKLVKLGQRASYYCPQCQH